MTTLPSAPHTALLVIDVQNGVVEGTHERDRVVENIRTLTERARGENVPVVWVQHADEDLPRGDERWEVVPELSPGDEEPRIDKEYGDAFEGTDLAEVLTERGVGRLIICGAQTDQCIRSTLHGALTRGYDTVLVSDAHTTEDNTEYGAPSPELVIAHTNLYWSYQEAPGRQAGTVTSPEAFSAAS